MNPSTPTNPPVKPPPWTPPARLPERFEALGLVLRSYRSGTDDERKLFEAVESSRPTLHPWLPWALVAHRTIEETRAWIAKTEAEEKAAPTKPVDASTAFIVGIFDAASGELLGGTGFNRLSAEWHNAETGYWVRHDRRRQRIASRALAASLSWGFLPQDRGGFGFRRIHIFASDANTASCGVPETLGLRRMQRARKDRWIDGLGWRDSIGWDVLAEEWDGERHGLRVVGGD